MKSWVHFAAGSAVVYVAMTACAGGAHRTPTGSEPNAAAGHDAMTDPVPGAEAARDERLAPARPLLRR